LVENFSMPSVAQIVAKRNLRSARSADLVGHRLRSAEAHDKLSRRT
jgi:hypothetical protein